MFTDPIADMLTRIRNGLSANKATVTVPYSKLKHSLANILVKEGYLTSVSVGGGSKVSEKSLEVVLKYINGEGVILGIQRVSKPGQRIYTPAASIPRANGGTGLTVLSTPKGLMADREARRQKFGGEVICQVW